MNPHAVLYLTEFFLVPGTTVTSTTLHTSSAIVSKIAENHQQSNLTVSKQKAN